MKSMAFIGSHLDEGDIVDIDFLTLSYRSLGLHSNSPDIKQWKSKIGTHYREGGGSIAFGTKLWGHKSNLFVNGFRPEVKYSRQTFGLVGGISHQTFDSMFVLM